MAISQPTKAEQYLATSTPFYDMRSPGNPLFELVSRLVFTAAGFTTAAAGDLQLLRLPGGRIRIRTDLSRIVCPIGTATSDLDIGLSAYTKPDGSAQVAQPIVFADSLDVGGGAINQNLPLPAGGNLVVDSIGGADVVCSFDTANSPAAGVLILTIIYQRDTP